MKNFIFALAMTIALFSQTAFAGPGGATQRLFSDIKLPTQAVMEHDVMAGPLAASATYLLSGGAVSSASATTITSFLHSGAADYARNVTITPGGTTSNVGAGTAVVNGLDINGYPKTDYLAITSAQSTATVGSLAFKSITSIVFPQATGSGVTVSVGIGSKLGLRRCLNQAGDYVFSENAGAYDSTRGTVVASAAMTAGNVFTPNGTLNGSNQIDVYYVQNFRCHP